jgi:hypothetical protein
MNATSLLVVVTIASHISAAGLLFLITRCPDHQITRSERMWSSFRYYRLGETGLVKVGSETVPVFAGSK